MGPGRKLYVAITGTVVFSLLGVGFAGWCWSGFGGSGRTTLVSVMLAACIAGAVGVIYLGWWWLRLAEAITSMAKRVNGEQASCNKLVGGQSISKLSEAITDQLCSYRERVTQFEEQVTDLQIQIRVAQRQRNNAEAIIYSIRDAVIVTDEFDKLLMANEAAGRLFDFDCEDSRYQPIDIVIGESQRKFVDFLRQSRRNKSQATKREIQFIDGEKSKTFDCIVSCVRDQSNQVCGVVAVLHDVTNEKEIAQMKNDFVSHVSHELKTPLASIMAYSEMLVDGEAGDDQTRQEFYSVIQSQAERLSRLIEDILNISRIESGLIKINRKPLSLTILIEEQLQMIKGYAEEKSIDVVSQKPIVFDQVQADKDMITQVVVNLLSNAVKYTPANGSIRIETEVDEQEGLARVKIKDTGVGIPADEVEHVFDKFYRVSANNGQAKGTGLGLNLVKQIIEKVHNGRVFVTSEVGVGSTFGFELPLATAPVAEAQLK